ncbi:aminopeptidase P family protein [Pseudohoeflea coraliihabitans]|uniref:Aminopeptidase P family protein n=1 Tax=Pseudohoeflea coraliihabitans TaxID=2860393 RepID=A0ABS6WJ89_9HYPH|nr:aminopeptidase P family protein [Pseudohoeflea sp. DP4N28-3]MBW3095905.1 aminopeptidase P family protein [Pseudohoeflea sp. DP4N28-3]
MFQNFDVPSAPHAAGDRLAALRLTFSHLGVDAIAVPRGDEFLGEYVPDNAERLAFLTSFTGSAGLVLVERTAATLFVDGRYTAQARTQTDPAHFSIVDLVSEPLPVFLQSRAAADKQKTGAPYRLGIDPWTWPGSDVERLKAALDKIGGELVLLRENPVDAIWTDRPAAPCQPVTIQPLEFAGEPARDKLARLQDTIAGSGADAAVLSDPSSIAWSFNIRGSDLPSTPHPLSRAILPANERPTLFIEPAKLNREVEAYLTQLADLAQPDAFETALRRLAASGARILVSPASAPHAISELVESAGGTVIAAADPAQVPRAVKNEAELSASAEIHRQDGAAMVRFLAWFDAQPPGSIDEIAAATQLEAFRASTGAAMQRPLMALSFDTISGAGPNAAIIHYRVNRDTNRQINAGEMYLVDSGGQYVPGTTDITRTLAVGAVPAEQRRFFTLILKGMIAISRLRFPAGTRGIDIDAFARQALWQGGVDYAHGTGHGVGSYLSVHEGPQSLSRRGMQELLPGMILSNEPGYYRDGAFGIRIENLVYVHEPRDIAGGDRPMLGFETLTLCPIDRRLIVPGLLDDTERHWLNAYHARVRDSLSPLLGNEVLTRQWLTAATADI